jgi:hypothetical protein
MKKCKKPKMRKTWYTGYTSSKRSASTMAEKTKQQRNRKSTNGDINLPMVREGIPVEEYEV